MSIDMAKMKTEVQAARVRKTGLSWRDRMIANLPRFAPLAAATRLVSNIPLRMPALTARLGFSRNRRLPLFQKPFDARGNGEVLLFADTFNRHFDPETLRAAKRVIERGGRTVGVVTAPGRPLCCGRSYLSVGAKDKALAEMRRTTEVFRQALAKGKIIVGLEPSCTLMFRDEVVNLIPDWTEDLGARVLTFAEYLAANPIDTGALTGKNVMIHGHCHQKALGVANDTVSVLKQCGAERAEMIDSSCCGMAGSFGYQSETEAVSRDMAELSLAPALRAAPSDTIIVAEGFSCRCQIRDTTARRADSLAIALDKAMSA